MSSELTTSTTTGESILRPEDERLSPGKSLGYGIQHILSMFGGVVLLAGHPLLPARRDRLDHHRDRPVPDAGGRPLDHRQPTVGGEPNPNFLNVGNIGLAKLTLAFVLVLSKIKVLSRLAILLGLMLGTLVALTVGRRASTPSGTPAPSRCRSHSPSAHRCSRWGRSSR